MRRLITYSLFALSWAVGAQDIHFTQYYLSPLNLNPANTGKYRGDYRFFANYRNQWKLIDDAYNTYSAGGDFNFYPDNVNVSGGMLLNSDRSGGDLVVNQVLLSGAIHRRVKRFQVSAGVQPALVMKTFDQRRNSLPDQLNWDTGLFDHNLPTTEDRNFQQLVYPDLNAGFNVSRRFRRFEPELGMSLQHILRPAEGFLNRSARLDLKSVTNLQLSFFAGERWIFRLHNMFAGTTGVNDWLGGLNVEYVVSSDAFFTNSVFAGVMYRGGYKRNSDAGIGTIGFNYSHYTVAFSYDITNSGLKTSVDRRGALELALIYRAKSTRLNKKQVRCARH